MDKHILDELKKINDLSQIPRLERLKSLHRSRESEEPEICLELPRHITFYRKAWVNPGDSPELRAGKLNKYVLELKKPLFFPDENLLAGTTTSKPIGVLLYPDFLALAIWPELETLSRRPKNPFRITRDEIDELNTKIFPFWMGETVQEVTRKENPHSQSLSIMEKLIFFLTSKVYCISHTIPNYGIVVERGLSDLIKEAEAREKGLSDGPKKDFYKAVQLSLKGIITYAQHLASEAERLASQEDDPKRQLELLEMSEICKWVPAEKPRTFREALNAVWMCKVALHQENANSAMSLGRLDQILYPFYWSDRKQGMTLEEAIELVGCFWLKMADHVPLMTQAGEEVFGGTGSNQAITLGGIDMEGKDAVNELTHIMLKVTELLKLRDPNVNARYCPGVNAREYLIRLCEANEITGATPCFHNDTAVIETLTARGTPLEHARDYSIVGCVEPSIGGRTYGHHGSILMNLTAALEMALWGGTHRFTGDEQIGPSTKPAVEMTSFDEFKAALETHLSWLIVHAIALNNQLGRVHQRIHPSPMLSAIMENCMDKGEDVVRGGALYNSSGVAIIGLAEVVDSMAAIEEFVFNKKKLTMKEMLEAIKANWEEPYKRYHAMVKTSKEKFGTDSQMAAANANWLIQFIHDRFEERENYRGGRYTVGYWTMTNHAGFGALTEALPSGRKEYEPFASGITPVSGSAPVLTSCLNFVAGLGRTKKITNGQALNLKLTPSCTIPFGVADDIEAFFKSGGLQVQFNIIDQATLQKAYEDPEGCSGDFLVRVSGYTAYFKDLTPSMQKEIIDRALYDLNGGTQIN